MNRFRHNVLRRLWWGSLPVRVLVTTLGLSMLVMVLVGIVVLQQITAGAVGAKREAALREATSAHASMEEQLRDPETRGAAIHETLNRLADLADAQAAQYRVVIQGPSSSLVTAGIAAESVPTALRERVNQGAGMYITPTRVLFTNPSVPPAPGWAIGTTLVGSEGERYPVFYIFPMTVEVGTIQALGGAVVGGGVFLAVALGVISYLITTQVVRPVRKASRTALGLASGRLDERMVVRGTDDLAILAESMNQMASQLQERIRQLETLSTLQQRFVSDVSHELRTPMTTIKMASEVIYDGREAYDPTIQRTAELMHDEIERFDSLLADLLEISRFDAGAAVLSLEEACITDLVETEVIVQQPVAERLGTCILVEATGEDTQAMVDSRRIRRIIRNLLTNAIEHAEGQPITIEISSDETTVTLVVRDRGVGFQAGDAERVFDRFWRADPSRARLVGGSGLGLAIAREDAHLHDGTLTAWGHLGQGAEFRLLLPRGPAIESATGELGVKEATT